MAKETTMMKGGHLYIQTNEIENAIIHYQRSANGMLTEVTRVRTGGAGSGEYKPISGQESAPNSFEGASSIFITAGSTLSVYDQWRRQLGFYLPVGDDGRLTLVDVKATGNPVEGQERHRQVGGLFAVRRARSSCCTHLAPITSG